MQFRVTVRESRTLPHAIVSGGEALIEVLVAAEGQERTVPFMIDTGADVTVLSADDSLAVLGSAALGIDFARDPRSLQIRGIGGSAQYVVRDATMTLRSTEGEHHSLAMPILIAEPAPPRLAEPGPPQPPSVLGRDFLRRFHLELRCGDQRRALLETL